MWSTGPSLANGVAGTDFLDTNTANFYRSGSGHAGGFMMSFADGSTHIIGYDVDPTVHRLRGSRNDRQPTAAP